MKRLLLPIDSGDYVPSAFHTAALLAATFDATVDAVALRPNFSEIAAPDPIVAVSVSTGEWDEQNFVTQARAAYDRCIEKEGPRGAAVRWRSGHSIDDADLGSLARVYDVTVIARPGGKGSRMSSFEAALFESGRMVLMAPPTAPATMGESIVIHWNRSTETATATALALPILKRARQVVLLSVEGNAVAGPGSDQAQEYLAAHGIKTANATVASKGRGPGEAILSEAKMLGADLLVKGAYTQSRLRQMIFGGATSYILAKSELPVLFAHS